MRQISRKGGQRTSKNPSSVLPSLPISSLANSMSASANDVRVSRVARLLHGVPAAFFPQSERVLDGSAGLRRTRRMPRRRGGNVRLPRHGLGGRVSAKLELSRSIQKISHREIRQPSGSLFSTTPHLCIHPQSPNRSPVQRLWETTGVVRSLLLRSIGSSAIRIYSIRRSMRCRREGGREREIAKTHIPCV